MYINSNSSLCALESVTINYMNPHSIHVYFLLCSKTRIIILKNLKILYPSPSFFFGTPILSL